MKRKAYSAGAVKVSFWFAEFRKVVQLLNDGTCMEEIRNLALKENLFAAPTTLRATQIFRTVSSRVLALDGSFLPVFLHSDLASQKLIALIAAMADDALFFDFVYEVFREKLILGGSELTDRDVRVFFRDKQQQSERVSRWTEATLVRLGQCYQTMLHEAGLIGSVKASRTILRPILDPVLTRWLAENGMTAYIDALTGAKEWI